MSVLIYVEPALDPEQGWPAQLSEVESAPLPAQLEEVSEDA